jgi:hypothetical protein
MGFRALRHEIALLGSVGFLCSIGRHRGLTAFYRHLAARKQ